MKSRLLIATALLALSACGNATLENNDHSNLQSGDIFGYRKMTVSALVINESSAALDVNFRNSGPHDGGCDDKSYVPFKVESKQVATLSEDWYCKQDQWFYIEVKHPILGVKIKGSTGSIICNDGGCRELDVAK